jgi:hypothetical protein
MMINGIALLNNCLTTLVWLSSDLLYLQFNNLAYKFKMMKIRINF